MIAAAVSARRQAVGGPGGQNPTQLFCRLFKFTRLSGDQVWRGRAAKFAQDAVRFVSTKWCTPNSLYKGDLGIALLAGDLADPSLACMPMFGPEGWPRRPTGKRIVEEADGRVSATEP
jgi:hypothetical protein